jgi:hypothetical protein
MCIDAAWKVLWITPFAVCANLAGAERPLPKGDAAGFQPTRAEQLLPPSTVAFLSVPDCPATIKKWSQAGFRPVWSNPTLRTLLVQLEALLPNDWRRQGGFAWRELLELPAGEACLALAQSEAGQPAGIIILACRGRERTIASFFDRLGALESQNLKPTKLTVRGAEIVRYKSLSYFIKDDVLAATCEPRLTEQLAQTWVAGDGLINGECWHAVLEQAEMNKEAADPDIRWFIRPREFVNAFAKAKNSPVVPKIGLDLVRCAGGGCWLAHGEHAALYRIGLFVPGTGDNGRKPLLLPQTELHDPPEWVPATAAGYASFRCDLHRGVAAFGDLVDRVVGEPGVFHDTLTAAKLDPAGPHVDLEAELYQKLRSRVIMLWGPEQPAASAWASCGFALEVADERSAASVVDRLYANEPKKKRQVDGATFYYEEEDQDEDRTEETPKAASPPGGSKASPKPQPELIAFIGVVHQCLLAGVGKELFSSLSAPKKPLAAEKDYRRVAEALDRLAASPVSGRSFSRAGDDFRLMEQCVTPVGIVPSLGRPGWTPDVIRSITGKLPPSEACLSHCGPGGWVAHPTPQGCRVVGCVLRGYPAEGGNRKADRGHGR